MSRVVVAMTCAVVCLAGAAQSASAASPPVVSAVNGFSAMGLPTSQLNPQLAAMAAQGVQMVRSDAAWATIEPVAPGPLGHVFQWATTDAWVTALATHHLAWEPVIDYSVGWAKTCAGFCAPTSDSTYAAFAQAVAARYGAGGSFWSSHPQLPYVPAQIFEIWNEENTSMFWIDPARYATLYSAARSAIDAVDSQAAVIVGGLADDSGTYDPNQDYPAQYVIEMLAADPALTGAIDGFGLHPYGANATDVENWTVHFRHALANHGEGSAPIYITEFGWETGSASTESWRAQQMSNVALALGNSNCGLTMLAPYTWINPLSLGEAGDFGLVDRTGLSTALRPAGTAWFTGLAKAARQPSTQLCPVQSTATTSTGSVTTKSTSGATTTKSTSGATTAKSATGSSARSASASTTTSTSPAATPAQHRKRGRRHSHRTSERRRHRHRTRG